jgi:hypothetical protein
LAHGAGGDLGVADFVEVLIEEVEIVFFFLFGNLFGCLLVLEAHTR